MKLHENPQNTSHSRTLRVTVNLDTGPCDTNRLDPWTLENLEPCDLVTRRQPDKNPESRGGLQT
jgi:hypothetical protein